MKKVEFREFMDSLGDAMQKYGHPTKMVCSVVFWCICTSMFAQNTAYRTNYKTYSYMLYQQATVDGNAAAMNDLGSCYDRGAGVEKNISEAYKWFRASALKGNMLGQYNLGLYYEKNYATVDENDPQLYFDIAKAGTFVDKNLVAARHWYFESAKQGFPGAQMKAADFAYKGIGGEKNLDEAQHYYELCLKTVKHPVYYYNLGNILSNKGEFAKAIPYYEKAASMGLPEAYILMGAHYHNGSETLPQNYEKAFMCYSKAAEHNYPLGYFMMGNMFYMGHFVAKDYDKAIANFRKAADKGVPEAQYTMGKELYSGIHTQRDYREALNYLFKALENKSTNDVVRGDILMKLSSCYRYGLGVDKDETKAEEYFKEAEKYGNVDAKAIRQWLGHE